MLWTTGCASEGRTHSSGQRAKEQQARGLRPCVPWEDRERCVRGERQRQDQGPKTSERQNFGTRCAACERLPRRLASA